MAFIIIITAITKSITFIVAVVVIVVGSGAVVLSSGHDYCQ